MTKYHPYARRRLRSLFRRWVHANLWRVAVLLAGAALLIAFETWMFLALDLSEGLRWFLIGLVPTLIAALVVAGLFIAFLTHEPEGIHQVRGAWGEDFTRDELVRARRKRLIWGWVDSVTVQGGDIDHLVVTRSGGLLALDSKWRSDVAQLDPSAMAAEASRARLRAEGVVQTLVKKERGSHRAPAKSFRVTPLVVIWGGAGNHVPESASVEGVGFVPGRGLVDWISTLAGEAVDEAAAADLLSRLEDFRRASWRQVTTRSTS